MTEKELQLSLINRVLLLLYHTLFLTLFLLSPLSAATAGAAPGGINIIFLQRGTEQIAVFTIETVADQKAVQKGLAERAPMPDDFGMLFILDSTLEQFFWMKGMEFPLDILFFDKNKKLVEILPDLLPCDKCTKYKAPANTAYALELSAGIAAALGIKTGDEFVFRDK